MNFEGVDEGVTKFGSIGEIVSQLLVPIFTLAGMVALLFLLWGGLRYMMSRGDPKAVDSARSIITSAIIGLLIVILSGVIMYIVSSALKFNFLIYLTGPVYAVDIGDVKLGGTTTLGTAFADVGELLTRVVYVFLAIAALIFLLMTVWGGFKYLSAGGDPKSAAAARETITGALIGLLIIVVSFFIIQVILNAVGADSIIIFGTPF